MAKVGRNEPCPCGIGKKYKNHCLGRVDWEALVDQPAERVVRHLSTRGKNKLFLAMVFDALQLDADKIPVPFSDFKRAFTSAAVRRIYEALAFVWPDGEDLKRVLQEEAGQTTGLYIGRYEQRLLERGIARHSLYADRILLVDPMMHPARIREEFNPLAHPEIHRVATLKWISIWLSLAPWIDAGLVGFVRAPGDFYPELFWDAAGRTLNSITRHSKELEPLREAEVARELESDHQKEFVEDLMLSMSDDAIRRISRERKPDTTDAELEQFIEHIQKRRDTHPYFLEREQGGPSREMYQMSSGTNYEQAKMIAHHSQSYVMTDIGSRWKEIELDRADSGIDSSEWSPFAKAFQGLPFQFLDSVPLNAALMLRKEGRLEALRGCLRKAWNATAKLEPFDDANIPNLAAELTERIQEAETEWKAIDRDLVKVVSAEAAASLLAAGPLVASGHAAWLGAAAAVVGTGNLVVSTMKRKAHKLEYPAGFFVDLRKGRYG